MFDRFNTPVATVIVLFFTYMTLRISEDLSVDTMQKINIGIYCGIGGALLGSGFLKEFVGEKLDVWGVLGGLALLAWAAWMFSTIIMALSALMIGLFLTKLLDHVYGKLVDRSATHS